MDEDLHYYRAVATEGSAEIQRLRAERDELILRVAELSTALEAVTEQRDNREDAASSLLAEVDGLRHQNAVLAGRIARLHEYLNGIA